VGHPVPGRGPDDEETRWKATGGLNKRRSLFVCVGPRSGRWNPCGRGGMEGLEDMQGCIWQSLRLRFGKHTVLLVAFLDAVLTHCFVGLNLGTKLSLARLRS